MTPDLDRRVIWRDRRVALGLCKTCGARPVTVSATTGKETRSCAICLAREREKQRQRRGGA